MGIRYKKNQPKKPSIKLDNADIGKRVKHTDELPDDPIKPTIKPTVIKPLLGEYDSIAKANVPQKKLPEPTVIKPFNATNYNTEQLQSVSSKKQHQPDLDTNKPIIEISQNGKTKPDDLSDIWSEQEKIRLEREAEEKHLKEQKRAQKQAKKAAKKQNKAPNIFTKSINKAKNQEKKAGIVQKTHSGIKNKRAVLVGFVLVAIPIGILLTAVTLNIANNNKKLDSGSTVVQGQETKKADFAIITPNGSSNATTKYDSDKKVVSYADKIAGTNVIISQQQLPDSFKSDVAGSVRKMAEQFYANTPLDVDDASAYLGTSIKGPQTVIINKNSLLIFMQSEQQIDKKEWAEYINSLKIAAN